MLSTLQYVVLVCITLQESNSLLDAAPATHDLGVPILNRRDDYTYTPGVGAHKIHTQWVTWNTARRNCEAEGAYLAITNSVAEANAIAHLLKESNVWQGLVGLHDLYHEEEFVTIHGESVAQTGYNVWVDGEPNNSDNEDCVGLQSDGKLNDVPCSWRGPFICELDTDQPTAQALSVVYY